MHATSLKTEHGEPKSPVKRKMWAPFWYVREAMAAGAWIAAIVKLVIVDFDIVLANQYFPQHAWMLQYKFFVILSIVVALSLLLTRSWFRSFFIYVVFYPVVVFFYLVLLVCHNWPVVIAFAPGIYSLVTTLQTSLVWFSVAILAAFVISVSGHPWLVSIAMFILAAFLCRHIWHDARRAFMPTSVFADLGKLVEGLRDKGRSKLTSQLQELAAADVEDEAFVKKKKEVLLNAYVVNSLVTFIAGKCSVVARSRMFEVYLIFTVMFTLFLTLTVFGFEYVGVSKLDPEAFKPQGDLGPWQAIGFSVNTMTTASVAATIPVSVVAQVLCYVEILFGLILVSISAAMVIGVVRERYREDLQLVIAELKASEDMIVEKIGQEVHLTYDELEVYLVETSLEMINGLRYMRGLAPLPKPTPAPPPDTPDVSPANPNSAGDTALPNTNAADGRKEFID